MRFIAILWVGACYGRLKESSYFFNYSEGQLEETNRHNTRGCEVLSPLHLLSRIGCPRNRPASPLLQCLVSSAAFRTAFPLKGPGDQRVSHICCGCPGLEEPTLQNKVTVPRGERGLPLTKGTSVTSVSHRKHLCNHNPHYPTPPFRHSSSRDDSNMVETKASTR